MKRLVLSRSLPIHYYSTEVQIIWVTRNKDYCDKLYEFPDYCELCHRTNELEIHHIIPVVDLGSNKRKNLIVLCSHCHDYHTEKITRTGHYNKKIFKKARKLLLKYYKKYNQSLISIIPKELIDKHIRTDSSIKYCLKNKLSTRALEILRDIKSK
jgi:hypothetical protein